MSDWLGLAGRKALVLGAGGLGGESALSLARAGVQIVLVDAYGERVESLAEQIRDVGGEAQIRTADLTDGQTCRDVVADAWHALGSFDIYLHAIGRNERRPILDIDDEVWSDLVTLNLSTAYWSGQAAGRRMCAQGHGRMVFVSSVSGLLAHADHAPYAATKGGLNQLMRVMAREWAGVGVTVNAVAPGYVETDLTRDYLSGVGVREGLERLVPAGRLGTPGDVADAVTFLVSDRASFITGHVLYIDGGRVLV